MEPKNQVNRATRSGVMAISEFSSERAKWKSLQMWRFNFFCDSCKFAFSQLDFMPRGMIWSILGHFVTPFSPRKSGFFQRKGRKRVKEWREVTFMKEWVKALYIGYHQALDLPKKLFPFPRTGHLKISLGPTQFLYSKFHGLLKLIFHTNQYNGA